MWNWLLGSVASSENVLKHESDVGSISCKVPPAVEASQGKVSDRDRDGGNEKCDSSEHELDSTETEAKDLKPQKHSPPASEDLIPEDPIPSAKLREVTSSGLQALSTGFSSIFSEVTGAVKSSKIISEFLNEEEKFTHDKAKATSIQTEANPPWYGYNESDEMKTQILEISSSRRNLLREPPPGSMFQFSIDLNFGQAMLMLEQDPRLDQVRFDLVPKKISEMMFWKNYFYRVHLVKQSVQLGTLKREEKVAEVGAGTAVSPVTTDEIDLEEFVSDALDIQVSDAQQLTQEELNQLKLNTDTTGQEKTNDEAVFDDALDRELDEFNPDDVKDEDFDYAELDDILKDN